MEMRKVLCDTLDSIMSKDERIIVIDADLAKANGTITLRDKYPDRAFDVGIAEQNMVSVAAGLASYGYIPFVGSFTPFASRRVCDQIAISCAYAGQSVKIIGSDPGITAELNGGTHMSMEDIGVLRSIPNMLIFEPVDNVQLEQAIPQIIDYKGPVYIRMFRKIAPAIFDESYKFDMLKADVIKEGKDVTIIASGIMVSETVETKEKLKELGIDAEIISVHTIKPIDEKTIVESAKKTGAVVTCENHNIIGGLRSAVAEVLGENNPVPIKSIGVKDHFGEVAKTDYLKQKYNMTKEDIIKAVQQVIELKK